MVHESLGLYNINNKINSPFKIIRNDFRDNFHIAISKKFELDHLKVEHVKDRYSHVYMVLLGKEIECLVWKNILTRKDGKPRKYPKRIQEMGKRIIPLTFVDSLDASLYIDSLNVDGVCGGLTPIRSAKIGKYHFEV